ncbi:MAG: hypothetical protein G3W58_02030 [Pantoea ananatis]|nr:hypothetical protein [Pantoea ananatis]
MQEQTTSTLKDITDRVGWRLARQLLGTQLGITAVGLEPFIDRFRQLSATNDEAEAFVSGVWQSLILSGNRLVKLYKLESETLLAIQSSLGTLQTEDNVFTQSYPIPLSKEQLLLADNDLHFVENVTALIDEKQVDTSILTSKAYYTQIIELDAAHLSEEGLELKANGGEIKCKTRDITQCFNTIMVIPSENVLVLTVDLSVLPRTESERQQFLVERFVRDLTGITLPPPLDLFGLVQELYEQQDGRISRMAFITSDGNTSSLTLKPGQNCLRNDSYHHGGESASPILTKYKIGKIWDLQIGASQSRSVELILPGKRAMIDKPNSHLYEASIEKCTTIEDVVLVIKKMLVSMESIVQKRRTLSETTQ